jgi:hypothetical protein
MKLQWSKSPSWYGQVTHTALVPSGKYEIHQCKGRSHFPCIFQPLVGESIDVGWDEPWNLRQAKAQCQTHADMGSPVDLPDDELRRRIFAA